jgi:hypothetical protein
MLWSCILPGDCGFEQEKEAPKSQNQEASRVHRPRERADRKGRESGKGISPGTETIQIRSEFQPPTLQRRQLADRQHQAFATELANARIFIGASDLLEPIEKLQFEEEG